MSEKKISVQEVPRAELTLPQLENLDKHLQSVDERLSNIEKKACLIGPVLDIGELAGILKICKTNLYKKAKRKEIPSFKIDGALRFRSAEIEEWIREQR